MSWKDELLPASFRGAPFFYVDATLGGGRRLAEHEFPLRDKPYIEDLGARKREHKITGYVIGDDYMAQRDALEAALDADGEGELVHPYRGPIQVNLRTWSMQELRDEGRRAIFQIDFVESGDQPSPVSEDDTSDEADDAADDCMDDLEDSFEDMWSIDGSTLQAGIALLQSLTLAFSPLIAFPGVATLAFSGLVDGLVGSVADAAAIAGAITGFCAAYAEACVASVEPFDETLSSRGPDPAADPSYGLKGLAAWADGLPAALGARQAQNQAALAALVKGSATAAIAKIFARAEFDAQGDADAARSALTGMIDGCASAAGEIGDDNAFRALQSLYGAVSNDLTTRAMKIPVTVTHRLGAARPALMLAARWYDDPSRAPELVRRNDAPHPLFVGPDVEALAA